MIKIKIIIGADHQGIDRQLEIIEYLKSNEIEVEKVDLENHPLDDYPDFAVKVCEKVLRENALGVLICKSGIGMSIAANKIRGIRCAKVVNEHEAFLAKNHNGANVISLDCDLNELEIERIMDAFIATKNPSEERHLRRIEKINKIENGAYNEL